jgi:glutamyl-tRNA synthetase
MVRTRFAPSPTGYLHIGGVRTALFNWLFARRHGGQFILRIDDTDQQRNITEALQPILDGLRWLGISWDEGPEVGGPHAPYFQSQRSAYYQEAVEELLRRGAAYRDYATPEEYDQERQAARARGEPFAYSRRWMATTDQEAARWEAEGRRFVVRLKMPRDGTCQFHDLIRGRVEVPWNQEPDHVVQRADGSFTYHLASVVDDFHFGITHVIRAVEHLSNTPRQIFIAQSLDYPLPIYAHLPYVAEPGSQTKLSKRKIQEYLKNKDFDKLYQMGKKIADKLGYPTSPQTFNPVLVEFYKLVGFLPDALVNYLLLLGWSLDDKTEYFTRQEMIDCFDLDRVNRSPASFDAAKLMAFQERYMKQLPVKQKPALVLPFLQKVGWVPDPPPCHLGAKLLRLVEAMGDRLKVAGDILQCEEFFVEDDQLRYDERAVRERLATQDARSLLAAYRGELQRIEPFEAPVLEKITRAWLEARNVPLAKLVHPLRLAVTGKTVGLGLFDTLEILGRQSCLRRIERALDIASQSAPVADPSGGSSAGET